MWLDEPSADLAVASPVVEAHLLLVSTRYCENTERIGVDDVFNSSRPDRRDSRMERRHPSAETIRQQLLDLDQGSERRILHTVDRRSCGVAQADSDSDGFVVVEQQRRHLCACCEAVAAFGSRPGIDGVAEFAQPIDVASNRALGDLEALSEFRSAPQTMGLQK